VNVTCAAEVEILQILLSDAPIEESGEKQARSILA